MGRLAAHGCALSRGPANKARHRMAKLISWPSTRLSLWRQCFVVAGAFGFATSICLAQTTDSLASGFQNPPADARPRVWWHWLDGNVSEQGIRKDLDWLHSVGIGGVH